MLNWFKQPYPFLYERLKTRLLIALFVLVFVYLFLIVFKPFDLVNVLSISIHEGAIYYALVSSLTVFIIGSGLIFLFPNYFSDSKWNVGREIIVLNVILIGVSISNGCLGYVIEICPPEQEKSLLIIILKDLKHSYSIGIFPVAILTGISYTIFLKRNLAQAMANNKQIESLQLQEEESIEKPQLNPQIVITSVTNNNDIELNLNQLLYVMADGNYVEFHLENGEVIQREIRRNTLSFIESQLSEFEFLFRSHRTFIVNLKKVVHSSGNAQGYNLKLHKSEQLIPVSRRNLDRFDELLRAQ